MRHKHINGNPNLPFTCAPTPARVRTVLAWQVRLALVALLVALSLAPAATLLGML